MAKVIIFPQAEIILATKPQSVKVKRADYNRLLLYLFGRMDLGKHSRDNQLELYENIDREYYGYLLRDQDDQKRDKDNKLAKGLKPVDEKLSMIFAQLDECVTYLLTVLAPDEAIYTAQAPKKHQPVASGFAA